MDAPPIPAVETINLTRAYGTMTALNSLNLTINRGDLFGFIGSNGAGKTTTLRILATFLAPSAGTAKGMSSRPITGMIHAGVAFDSCWRVLSQRVAMIQANTTIPKAPSVHITRATIRLTGATTSGTSNRLTNMVPNIFPAIGCWNSALTDCGAVFHLLA